MAVIPMDACCSIGMVRFPDCRNDVKVCPDSTALMTPEVKPPLACLAMGAYRWLYGSTFIRNDSREFNAIAIFGYRY